VEAIFELGGPWLRSAAILVGAAAVGTGLRIVAWAVLRSVSRRSPTVLDDAFLRRCGGPVHWIAPLFALHLAIPLALPADQVAPARHVTGVLLVLAIAWLGMRAIRVFEDVVMASHRIDVSDNLEARKLYTQFGLLRRVAVVLIALLSLAVILMSFPALRQLGTGLLASAGIVGIVVGFAAQRTLGNLIAGIQIAITEPIRIDDVVIVEGEWGRIEEITLTYVVVRIWDLRRLVVPISYFLEKPFENWTRVSADLLGTVFLHVDYRVPLEEVRSELRRIVEASELWDGKVCGLQVTDTSERSVELRALVSASDSSKAWDLRCRVREQLLAWLQRSHPESLPRVRASLEAAASAEAAATAAPGRSPARGR
jgi:small-conductance mechanosensitive channel